MDDVAEKYVKLVLSVGVHDGDYVDAYYGPPAWKEEAKAQNLPLKDIFQSATKLLQHLTDNVSQPSGSSSEDQLLGLRYSYLAKQLKAVIVHTRRLSGETFKFVEEAQLLYDVTPHLFQESHFEQIKQQLNIVLGGDPTVPLFQRYAEFRKKFIVPTYSLASIFQVAILECKKRTANSISLPAGENFELEFVQNKPWSAYNWYKGNSFSVIQVNTDLPIYIDRVIDLAAHEGYPGHHVYNSLLEENLVKKRDFVELSVYPLYSPQSLIAEGTANFGIKVAFPENQRFTYEKEVLFPLAGLDPSSAVRYHSALPLVARLAHADNMVAQRYLDGEIDKEKAIALLSEYALLEPQRAEQRLKFIEKYRSYVINYSIGQDMVEAFIEARVGSAGKAEKRWQEFAALISSPRLPSGLVPK